MARTRQKPVSRRIATICVLIVWYVLCSVGARGEEKLADLTKILGRDAGRWTIVNRWFKPMKAQTGKALGEDVVVSDRMGPILIAPDTYGPGTAISFRFRLAPEGRATAIVEVRLGLQKPDDPKEEGLRSSFSTRAGTDRLSWSLADPLVDPKDRRNAWIRGSLDPRGIRQRSLGWPEDLRRIIEHDMASQRSLDAIWLTVRYELYPDGFRAYLNDRLMAERRAPGLKVAGRMRVQLWPGAELAEISTHALPAVAPVFEPVALGGYVNASKLNGQALAPNALLSTEKVCVLGGVPFELPKKDARGLDQIDLGPSWLQTCYLEGRFPSRGGGVGGRWAGAFNLNPTRIQLCIPGGRYRAIHLLAAADNTPDSAPVVTVQFFRLMCGFPQQFAARVPLFTAKGQVGPALPVKLADGSTGRVFLVTIPVDTGLLADFEDLDVLELELTKGVKLWRAYPDPMHYSFHPAGLPSSVHVFAMTLERPAVMMSVAPAHFGDTWVAPEKASYTVKLSNLTKAARKVTLTIRTVSYDGLKKTDQTKAVTVAPGRDMAPETFTIAPPCYGYHDVDFVLRDGDQVWTERRSLVYLHEDTRERGDWQKGRGPIFGFWNWRGGHRTPAGSQQVNLMGMAGAESSSGSFESPRVSEEERAAARKWGMVTFKAFGAGDHYITNRFRGNLAAKGLEEAKKQFLADLAKAHTKAGDINRPTLISFFPEPHIGPATYGTLPSYYGAPPFKFSESEEARYQNFLHGFVEGARIVNQYYPGVKCLMPHGDPLFPVPFLRRSADVRKLLDGVTVDIPVFERLPEQQIHQVSLHRLWMCREEFRKAGKPHPLLPMYEGPSRSSLPGALSQHELADLSVRDSLILIGYGVDRQCGGWCPFDAGSYWGEQHYGGGICYRLPRATPKPALAAFGAMTRHLNRRNFTKWLPTGSLSVYALQFAHYKTGDLLHVFWTIRGTRPVTLTVAPGSKVEVRDQMDNPMKLAVNGARVTFTISTSPCWVTGVKGDPRIELGAPDQTDAKPAELSVRIASLGDGTWKQSAAPDEDYTSSHEEFVVRFPGNVSIKPEAAPAAQGGRALAVHLGKQKDVQLIMPYYTTLVPAQPLTLRGKGGHIGLWVRAASDWGRVVYALRDAKGERWISVGLKGQWNCDDMYNWSVFCFDGWRYLRFELPVNSPYDSFRELGTTWWGHYGKGDGIVDLPLKLEKIFVERRTHAMYVNSPRPTRPDDVLLGDLYVEYESPADKTQEAIRLSRLRMPVPAGAPKLENPIADMAMSGVGAPTKITGIRLPDQHADGTQCYLDFQPVEDAKQYDVWVSPYASGDGALDLGRKWAKPGLLLRGMRPDTDFYIWVVYTDAKGKQSKPSAPLKIRLKDMFGMK